MRTNPIIVAGGIGPDGCISPPDMPGIGWNSVWANGAWTSDQLTEEPV